jgi:NAD(P)H-flavin reductase
MATTAEALTTGAFRRVLRRRREAADTWTLVLDGGGTAFAPGQFSMLYAFGVGEIAISHAGDPARRDEHVHTVRAVGAVSRAIAAARPGRELGVRGPFGRGWPLADCRGRDVLLVGGGLGLAPLRPALLALLAARRDVGRVTLVVGARSPGALVYRAELARWARRRDVTVVVTVDAAGTDWAGEIGVVTAPLARLPLDPAATVALVCGPEPMLRFTAAALQARGLPADRIHASLERNMHCATGHCGRCQLGPLILCRDGPVVRYDRAAPLLAVPEL